MSGFEVFPFTTEFEEGLGIVEECPVKRAVIGMYRHYEAGTFDPEDEDLSCPPEELLRDLITVDRETALKLIARVLNCTLHYLDGAGIIHEKTGARS